MGWVLVHTVPVLAAGPWYTERGPASWGRAGADMAAIDHLNALHLNPAGLAWLRGVRAVVEGTLVKDGIRFEREAPGENFDPVTNDADPWPPRPGALASMDVGLLGLPPLVLAVGLYGPPPADTRWDSEGPQRYSNIASRNEQRHYAVGLGFRVPGTELAVGLTALVIDQVIDTRLKLNLASLTSRSEAPEYDVDLRVRADGFQTAGTLGVLWRPWRRLAWGVSYQVPYSAEVRGRLDLTLDPALEPLVALEGDRVAADLEFPGVLRTGLRYLDPEGDWNLELAWVWESWSRNDVWLLRPQGVRYDITLGVPQQGEVPDIALDNRWRDTHSVRLGGAWQVNPEWRLRGGAYYETGAVPLKRLSLSVFDLAELGGAVGLRWQQRFGVLEVWLDGAVGFAWSGERRVGNSEVRLIDPLEAVVPEATGAAVANGRYRAWRLNAAMALGFAWSTEASGG